MRLHARSIAFKLWKIIEHRDLVFRDRRTNEPKDEMNFNEDDKFKC